MDSLSTLKKYALQAEEMMGGGNRKDAMFFFTGLAIISILGLFFIILVKLSTTAGKQLIKSRRASTAKTPPRSVSPGTEKKNLPYVDTLPPQRRHVLSSDKKTVDEETVRKSLLPMTREYTAPEAEVETLYTPMGFSVKEVKTLGDFPDYSQLTGVPFPRAYEEFDIGKALPRPYRPLRWPYHQTMCMLQAARSKQG